MPEALPEDPRSFQVDLRGLVDLLSQHLYSSPRVYVRELLQNAVDAVTARRLRDPEAPSAIRIQVRPDGLRIHDPGIGLTEADAHRFLATIGRSSKRDELAEARREFLGQFGIGLLACFTVAENIRVVTRSATAPDAPTIQWLATSDGTYTVQRVPAGQELAEPGTRVELTPRPGAERWFAGERVVELAREYGALLPYEVTVEHEDGVVRTTDSPPVWDRAYPSPASRRAALLAYGESELGFQPLDVIELDLPLVGIRGVGYVLPQPANPTESGRHRIYLKGMLLGDAVAGLLPDWAVFLRCLVTTDALKPTASREALYEDDTLAAVREALGGRIRDWLTELAAREPGRLHAFLAVHAVGVKALACHDAEVLRIMLPYLLFETTDGPVSLAEFAKAHPRILVAPSVEEFRQVVAIAAAQGVGVANGGYTYDSELLSLLPELLPGVSVQRLEADTITDALDPVDPAEELRLAGFLTAARAVLDPLDCDVVLREFQPYSVSALHVDSRAARQERTRAETEAEADGLWAELLSALKSDTPRARLVLNHRSPVIRRLAEITDAALLGTAVEALYGQALLMTHRPLRPADTALLNRAFGDLLGFAMQVVRPTAEGREAA